MKNPNSLPRFFLACILWTVSIYLPAQVVAHLNANNVDAVIDTGANLFSLNYLPGFHVPKNSSKTDVFAASIWMAGKDSLSDYHCAIQKDINDGSYSDGPLAIQYDSVYDHYYKRVFKVTRADIEHFLSMS